MLRDRQSKLLDIDNKWHVLLKCYAYTKTLPSMIMEYICKYPSATLSRYALFTAVDDETLMFTSVHPGFLQWYFCVLERF
jgi:hypothetical protein